MDLRPYIENIHQQLADAAESGGAEARALAERLAAPLDAAIRLALQDALGAAAEQITVELAPGSVELRIRDRNPEFVVTPPPADPSPNDPADAGYDQTSIPVSTGSGDSDDRGTSRINLRMPDHLKARVDQAASSEGLSVNTWLVRAASVALDRADQGGRREGRVSRGAGRYTGWVR
ncbi:MAG: hypothetical protein WB804_07650 [Candidatus Dormiibacterota bacterium]